jgi:catechol 1,2-dioxygenase
MLNDSRTMRRRAFLKTSTMLVVAISAPVIVSCGDDKDPGKSDDSCKTTADILGPFYKTGAPQGENVIPSGNETNPLIILGRVYSNCDNPLQGAIVEIWNADEDGAYDMSDNYFFRGSYETSGDGIYKFKTIIPGRYLNGGTYRPSHIHFRITAPDHTELVSQVYFAEDPFIDDDPWASDPDAEERILTVTKSEGNPDTVNFDIHLSTAR